MEGLFLLEGLFQLERLFRREAFILGLFLKIALTDLGLLRRELFTISQMVEITFVI